MALVSTADVEQLHAKLKGQQDDLDKAILKNLSMSLADKQAWQKISHQIDLYLADEPAYLRAGTQMDTGKQWLEDLQPWFAKAKASGAAPSLVTPPPPAATKDPIGETANLVKWLLFGYLAIELVPELKRVLK